MTLSLPINQVRTENYGFCLMLVLVSPQNDTSVLFVFNLKLHIILDATRLFSNKSGFWKSHETQDLWLAHALVEARVNGDIDSCMSLKLGNTILL